MSSVIQNLLHSTLGDASRSTKFECGFQFTGTDIPDANGVTASVKTTSFPGKAHTPINMKYRGRTVPIRGQSKYTNTWDCTFYLTENHSLKHAFELWMEALDETKNFTEIGKTKGLESLQKSHNSNKFYRDINIYQLDFEENGHTSKYTINNAFPTNISAINVTYEGSAKVMEFTVTFSYTHFDHEVIKGANGNFIDSITTAVNDISTAIASSIGNFVNGSVNSATNILDNLNSGETITAVTKINDDILKAINFGGISSIHMPNAVI